MRFLMCVAVGVTQLLLPTAWRPVLQTGAWWCPGGWETQSRQCCPSFFSQTPVWFLDSASPPSPGGLCCMSERLSSPARGPGLYPWPWSCSPVASFRCMDTWVSSGSPEGWAGSTHPPGWWDHFRLLRWRCRYRILKTILFCHFLQMGPLALSIFIQWCLLEVFVSSSFWDCNIIMWSCVTLCQWYSITR